MINEIMLASALTFTNSNLFYDLNNNITRFQRDIPVSYINENETTNIIIDLNSGVSYLAWMSVNDSGTLREWEILKKEYQSDINGDLNISSYINYLYSNMELGANSIYTYSYLEMLCEFDIDGIDFSNSDYNTEVYCNSFFAIPSNVNENFLLQVCDTSRFNLDESNVNASNTLSYQNFASNSLNQDLFLIFSFNNLYFDTSSVSSMSFAFDFLFSDLALEFEIPLIGYISSWEFDNSNYSSFIYHDLENDISKLNNRIHALIIENDALMKENDALIKENDALNSKHVFSNIFEIVRGAFDGIVNFLEVELMPNITIGTILFIPVVIAVIFFILKALVL